MVEIFVMLKMPTECTVDRMKRRISKLIGIVVLAASLSQGAAVQAATHRNDTRKDCEKTRQKIARIESKMRQGYRASQGVKMEDELRRLRKLRSKQCR